MRIVRHSTRQSFFKTEIFLDPVHNMHIRHSHNQFKTFEDLVARKVATYRQVPGIWPISPWGTRGIKYIT